MSVQPSTRQEDEDVLYILRMRKCYGPLKAAGVLGMTSARVRTICNRIRYDDIKYSTKDGVESQLEVLFSYWHERKRK